MRMAQAYAFGSSSSQAISRLQSALNTIQTSLHNLKLILNADKQKCFVQEGLTMQISFILMLPAQP